MRHFVQMGCCDQFPRWLAGHKICPAIAAQTGKAPIKKVNITEKTKNQDRAPKYLATIILRQEKAKQGKPGWDKG
jgi:hypothetical protein